MTISYPRKTAWRWQECLTKEQVEFLIEEGEIDFAYTVPGVARFRANIFRQRSSYALAFRVINTKIPEIKELGLPNVLYSLAEKQRGLILITGPTGSGKSTTLASMIDYINNIKRCHIITIEDPIEYLHRHNQSIINQREIGADTKTYSNAMRAVLREDPDVILIGEMRDQETIATALTAAETGHLVFSTLHTLGAAKTIDRIIDVFPPHQQSQVRSQLSTVLVGIISQQLIRRFDNNGCGRNGSDDNNPGYCKYDPGIRVAQINNSIHTEVNLVCTMDSCIASLFKQV